MRLISTQHKWINISWRGSFLTFDIISSIGDTCSTLSRTKNFWEDSSTPSTFQWYSLLRILHLNILKICRNHISIATTFSITWLSFMTHLRRQNLLVVIITSEVFRTGWTPLLTGICCRAWDWSLLLKLLLQATYTNPIHDPAWSYLVIRYLCVFFDRGSDRELATVVWISGGWGWLIIDVELESTEKATILFLIFLGQGLCILISISVALWNLYTF